MRNAIQSQSGRKYRSNIKSRCGGVNPPLFLFKIVNTKRMVNYEKVYISVYLKINTDGIMKPVEIEWTDGTRYDIDKIIDERNAPPEHTGGVLTRKYKVIIKGREKIIYLDKQTNKWFVEKLVESL